MLELEQEHEQEQEQEQEQCEKAEQDFILDCWSANIICYYLNSTTSYDFEIGIFAMHHLYSTTSYDQSWY